MCAHGKYGHKVPRDWLSYTASNCARSPSGSMFGPHNISGYDDVCWFIKRTQDARPGSTCSARKCPFREAAPAARPVMPVLEGADDKLVTLQTWLGHLFYYFCAVRRDLAGNHSIVSKLAVGPCMLYHSNKERAVASHRACCMHL